MSAENSSSKIDELTQQKEKLAAEVIKNQQLVNNLYSRFEVLNRQETELSKKISRETQELAQLDADLEAKKLVLQNKNLDPHQYTNLQQQVADLNVDKQNLFKDYQELRDRPLAKRISNKLPERHYLPKE
ncbi:hypothetical protein SIN07_07205 [Pediococcus inopinatus]|uniref:Uncharacterized protein n=1 Tax=Pediococcus inopinatus TaxID=114090 RepID=A0ABZ0Q834_9LACO|nr:hypothetical protein [Pediococcus inopinatus]AVK99574.1 hypothetical protein PI20285_02305 [Pediococcus inopinatus]KRN63784.1 hypothetical protein IV83_GL000078 [Pediococcus inopinatus]WPC17296.1 hypothetical protein N6G94_08945 [Pediococcus inopinatus]WPC18661.1 hypothetical protein N6G95_05140 [Pediococcus inopinatus]WPC22275.1 hypothetical protein N6G96_03380 [Pediococcus inopinatus]